MVALLPISLARRRGCGSCRFVIGMVAAFYANSQAPVVYPIFIAITALARLIVLQGKEMAPQSIIFEASAILLLAVAATILIRFRQKPN
jgi:protein PsiE